jgi:smad nuclear-interacting protein 1
MSAKRLASNERSIPLHDDVKDAKLLRPSIEEPFEKANFALSGALAKDSRTGNTVVATKAGQAEIVSKYSEPADACQPVGGWRAFVFKGDECLETLYLHRKSFYVLGREEELADIVLNHPSCSKQHAALQYRKKKGGVPMLYIIDLESTNGTALNGEKMVPAHYIEIKDGDAVSFGQSTRDYIFKLGAAKAGSI